MAIKSMYEEYCSFSRGGEVGVRAVDSPSELIASLTKVIV